MRIILQYVKRHACLLVLTMLAAAATVAAQLLVTYFVGEAIDTITSTGVDYGKLYHFFLLIGICIGIAPAGQFLVSIINNRIAYLVLAKVREDAFAKLGRLPLRYLDGRAYGEVSSVILSDAEQFSDGLLLGFTQLFTGLATIAGVLIIMFVIRWEVALLVLCITPLSLVAARFIANRTYRLFEAQTRARADQTAFVDEAIDNLKVVRAYAYEEECGEEFGKLNETMRKKALSALFYSSTTNPVTRFINSIVYAAVAFGGALFVMATGGAFSVGNLAAFLSYSTQYTKPFNEISEVLAEFQNALTCAGRIFSLIGEEEQPSDEGNYCLGQVRGEVSLRNISFSYDPAKPLIEGLSLEAAAGKRIAIVGPTGCGKTTLINLLMRFYDVEKGEICVDGHNICDVTRASLRGNYGMVLQETWLKNATVRDNLCMGEHYTEEEIVAAAKATHAHSFIRRLPKGYDTAIGGEGSLSEGQKQLLCITRVMLRRPPMLILDEATSNIDTRTERRVQEAFAALMKGRTSFVVAHRLSTIENADLILVMQAGKVVEQGTHASLMAADGFYAHLYRAGFPG